MGDDERDVLGPSPDDCPDCGHCPCLPGCECEPCEEERQRHADHDPTDAEIEARDLMRTIDEQYAEAVAQREDWR